MKFKVKMPERLFKKKEITKEFVTVNDFWARFKQIKIVWWMELSLAA